MIFGVNKISDADAEPLFIKTITGFPLIPSPALAKNFLVSLVLLPLVEPYLPPLKSL